MGQAEKSPDVQTIIDHRPRQGTCVLLLPEMLNPDGEPRAAIAYADRHPRLFRNLAAALAELRATRTGGAK